MAERLRIQIGGCLAIVAVACSLTSIRAEADEPTGLSQAARESIKQMESKDEYTRKLAMMRLEALREPAIAEAIRHYADSKDENIRADSLRAIAAIEGAGAVPFLLEKLKDERRARVRWSILLALEPFRSQQPSLLQTFVDRMDDYSTEVRMSAVDIVSRVDDDAARAAILERYRKEQRPDVRRVLKTALGRMGLSPKDEIAAGVHQGP